MSDGITLSSRTPQDTHRTARRLVVGPALGLVLSSCGFDYATDRVNNISAGVNARSGPVDVLGAVVIAAQDDAGLLIATLVNNATDHPAALTAVTGGEAGGVRATDDALFGATIPRAGRLDLIDEGGIPVRGSFTVGDFVTVRLTFDMGHTARLDVPVVKPCYQYDPETLELTVPGGPHPTDDYADEPTPDPEGEFADLDEGRNPGPYTCDVEEAELPVETSPPMSAGPTTGRIAHA